MCKVYEKCEEIPAKAIVPKFVLKDKAAAEEFLSLVCLPVAVGFYGDVPESEEATATEEKIKSLEEQLAGYIEKQSVRNFQAKNIGCRNCGSSVAREYLKSDICPVCGADLRVQSAIDGELQRRQKIEDNKKLLEQQREINRIKTAPVLYLSNADAEQEDLGVVSCEDCNDAAPETEE